MKALTRTTVCLLLAFVFMTARAHADWQHLAGMPCEETTSIAQDAEGYMWFGTRLGLVRYDGYQLQVHRNDMRRPHAFSSCDIRSLCADRSGRVYAGSFFGLNTFDSRSHQIASCHFRGNDYVGALCVAPDGTLWVGTGSALHVIGADGHRRVVGAVPAGGIADMAVLADGSLLVATASSGLYHVLSSGRSVVRIIGTEHLGPCAVAAGPRGTAFVATRSGTLLRYADRCLTRLGTSAGGPVGTMLYSATRQCLLLGTDSGLLAFHGAADQQTLLSGRRVNRIYEDRAGNLWVSATGEGIWFSHRRRQAFSTSHPSFVRHTSALLPQFAPRHLADTALLARHADINCVYHDGRGNCFVGTQADGLYCYRAGQPAWHLTPDLTPWLHHNDCYALTTLPGGQMLMAAWDGLYVFDATTRQGHSVNRIGTSDISHMHILGMTLADRHTLWLGLVGGIARIDLRGADLAAARLTLYTHAGKAGLRQPARVSQWTDRHTTTGPYQLGGIYRIVCDRAGRTWACTSEPGLLRYDAAADAFRSVSGQYGIKGDNVHSMDIDRFGNYWLTTNYGIMQLRLDAQGRMSYQHLYTHHDGLPTDYFGNALSTRLADGTIAVINQHHLVTFAPVATDREQRPKTTAIADIEVGMTSLYDSVAHGGALLHDGRISLSHRQNDITVMFTTFDYGEETSVRYVYKLAGADTGYQLTDLGQNSIRYNQLQPGCYTLYYGVYDPCRKDYDGLQTLRFEIMQPLWWRWWAKVLYVLLMAGMAYAFASSRARRRRAHHQLEIMAIEKRNVDEQYAKMTQFYTRVIHEFMTPVTLVSELAHDLQQRVRPTLQATVYMLASHTDQLLDAMNRMVSANDDDSLSEAMRKAKEMTQTDQDFLRRCTESVNRHIADPDYTHRVLMDEVGASHATLYRKLKALTGMDSTSFIRSMRMKAACQIMTQEPGIRIGELATRVGYTNPKYFATCFKKEFGMTPREYLERG